MFGRHLTTPASLGLFLGEEDRLSCSFRKSLPHSVTKLGFSRDCFLETSLEINGEPKKVLGDALTVC
jgi:hypothetical protein